MSNPGIGTSSRPPSPQSPLSPEHTTHTAFEYPQHETVSSQQTRNLYPDHVFWFFRSIPTEDPASLNSQSTREVFIVIESREFTAYQGREAFDRVMEQLEARYNNLEVPASNRDIRAGDSSGNNYHASQANDGTNGDNTGTSGGDNDLGGEFSFDEVFTYEHTEDQSEQELLSERTVSHSNVPEDGFRDTENITSGTIYGDNPAAVINAIEEFNFDDLLDSYSNETWRNDQGQDSGGTRGRPF